MEKAKRSMIQIKEDNLSKQWDNFINQLEETMTDNMETEGEEKVLIGSKGLDDQF